MSPMTETELAQVEKSDLVNNDAARRLVAEIRRFRELSGRMKALDEAIDAVRYRRELGVLYGTLRLQKATAIKQAEAQKLYLAAWKRETELLEALDAKPVPMCATDPLEDIIPPVTAEERRA